VFTEALDVSEHLTLFGGRLGAPAALSKGEVGMEPIGHRDASGGEHVDEI
jgi:hypothetical protein